ncbi:beta-ketoacyl synthase chain length factor [Serratia microhaemolytica]|uniref:beta-ketoacyl synthase chain length factor n=1 Tax=Serratia microhaemolytica TaxID=2675110 RepID=UPI000FDD74AD|nr:beta-ketoacyl synthase chain length factor [Serratia microhaemolytica]
MKFALNLIDWQARAPGLSDAAEWQSWANQRAAIDPQAAIGKLSELPMMTARRLSSGSKLAVECGLSILRRHQVDALLYTSRHGELERNYRILQALATGQAVSPTDFTTSVHNAAVGNLTIVAQQAIPASSLSAGIDTFQQGLCEVVCLLSAGYQRVLMVDFDGHLPEFYHPSLPDAMPTWPYALALLFEQGETLHCQAEHCSSATEPALAPSLQFLQHYLRATPQFTLAGERHHWRWQRR